MASDVPANAGLGGSGVSADAWVQSRIADAFIANFPLSGL